ncbi:unnamed protein product [Mytilus coruscus]|uniref:DZIP3-like HEPN domain-containing protein n=1 Tax=Mytilus coruscus TaxID=42192 RepID=A0A6J8D685_MYTCO|nr:unnamed protein product [Mytilus coruscus]
MNPININTKTLCTFIKISERQPAMILNKLISEYCSFKNITIEKLLKQEQHQLYHKRIDTKSCCRCPPKFATYDKFITDKQWNALYELTTVDTSHICRSKQMECNERFVPKSKQTYNLSVAKALILNIPDILTYMKDFLCVSGFDKFLMQNQHELFHSMIEERCCKCCNMYRVHTEKPLIEVTEWNKLFMKKDNVPCKSDSTECCCQYALRNNVRYKHIDEKLVYKIFYVSGPIGVLNKIEGDALLCFVSWTVDDQPLQRTLQELLNMIKDKTFCTDISRSTLSPDLNRSDENEALKWMSMHLPPQNEALENVEPSLQIFVHDRDGLNVKSIHIPEDFSMPRRTRKFTDITTEENNFLVVVHGLSTIVYPVIKIQFDKPCPEEVFKKIRTKIYEEKTAEYNKDSHKDANKCRKKRIYLTHNKKQQLFSDNKDEPKNLDLKWMIYILKRGIQEEGKTEAKKSNIDQLNVIDNIRREIVQSSSGVLKDSRFKDIMYSIRKVGSKISCTALER